MMKAKAEVPKVKERLVAQKRANVLEQLRRVFKVWIILVLKGYCYNLNAHQFRDLLIQKWCHKPKLLIVKSSLADSLIHKKNLFNGATLNRKFTFLLVRR